MAAAVVNAFDVTEHGRRVRGQSSRPRAAAAAAVHAHAARVNARVSHTSLPAQTSETKRVCAREVRRSDAAAQPTPAAPAPFVKR